MCAVNAKTLTGKEFETATILAELLEVDDHFHEMDIKNRARMVLDMLQTDYVKDIFFEADAWGFDFRIGTDETGEKTLIIEKRVQVPLYDAPDQENLGIIWEHARSL